MTPKTVSQANLASPASFTKVSTPPTIRRYDDHDGKRPRRFIADATTAKKSRIFKIVP
jgi:hypothetical protein